MLRANLLCAAFLTLYVAGTLLSVGLAVSDTGLQGIAVFDILTTIPLVIPLVGHLKGRYARNETIWLALLAVLILRDTYAGWQVYQASNVASIWVFFATLAIAIPIHYCCYMALYLYARGTIASPNASLQRTH